MRLMLTKSVYKTAVVWEKCTESGKIAGFFSSVFYERIVINAHMHALLLDTKNKQTTTLFSVAYHTFAHTQ